MVLWKDNFGQNTFGAEKMITTRHILRPTFAMLAVFLSSCATMTEERPQPRVFLWTCGDFRNNSESAPFNVSTNGPVLLLDPFNVSTNGPDLFMCLSYCGQDDGDPSLPPLNIISNVELRVAGRVADFAIDTDQYTSREHICVTIPMQELKGVGKAPFKIEWRVGRMKSNTLIANLLENSVESTTFYPKTPRPQELRGVAKIMYADYNLWETNDTTVLGGQTSIDFFFNGDGEKPWLLMASSTYNVYGAKGKDITLDTGWSVCGGVSNEDVLSIWRKLEAIGIALPTWRDGPTSDLGRKWEWLYYTDPSGQQVYTKRDDEYYKVARTMERPVEIEFKHEPAAVGSLCEWSVKRGSEQWQAITEIFLTYCEAKRGQPAIESEFSRVVTQGDDQPCVAVTLSELLATPEKYHGKRVRVSGYHHAEFEHSSLSEGPDSIRKYKESVWLGSMSHFAKLADAVSHNDAFITVEGAFTGGSGGHLGLWAGEIDRLTKIEKANTEPSSPPNTRSPSAPGVGGR